VPKSDPNEQAARAFQKTTGHKALEIRRAVSVSEPNQASSFQSPVLNARVPAKSGEPTTVSRSAVTLLRTASLRPKRPIRQFGLAENLCLTSVGTSLVTKVLPNMKRITRKIVRGDLHRAAHSFAQILMNMLPVMQSRLPIRCEKISFVFASIEAHSQKSPRPGSGALI
jgi:hypothetical protein